MKLTTKAHLSTDVKSIPTKTGNSMVSFSVADNRYVGKNPDGSAKTKPVFVDCVAFGRNADYLLRVAQKGTEVFFEAEIDFDVLTYQNGTKVPKVSFVIVSIQALRKQKEQTPVYQAAA